MGGSRQGWGNGIRMGGNEQGQMDETRRARTGLRWAHILPDPFLAPLPQQVLVPPLLVPAQGPVRHVPLQPALGA